MRQLAKDYELSVGTVSNMLKRKCDVEEKYESNVDAERCRRLCKTSHNGLNDLNDMNGQVSKFESYVKFLSI